MSHQQIGSFQIRRPIPGSRSTFLADRDGELFALKTHWGAVLDENWRLLSETLGQKSPTSERVCTLREVGVSQEVVYAAAPYLDGYNVHQLIKAVGNDREVSQSTQHVRAICWLIAQFARAAEERTLSSFNPSLFDDEGVAPEELFVTQRGQVMILDPRWTGLRRLASGPETHTLAHMVAYAMPASWREGNVQLRTMVFALGTVLWELLAGYRLFRRESLVATLYRLSEHSIPNLTEINPYVSGELSQFVEETLGRPVESSLLEFACSLESFSCLDKVSGPDAVRDLVDAAFPAKLLEEEDEALGLELFLEQQGKRWSYVEESTTFVTAPPSNQMERDFELAWIADEDEVRLPPSTLKFVAKSMKPVLEVCEKPLQVPSVMSSLILGGVLCAFVLILLKIFGLTPLSRSTDFSKMAGTSEALSDQGGVPLKWMQPPVRIYPVDLSISGAEIDLAVEEPLNALGNIEPIEASSNVGDTSDLLLILPPGTSAYLGDRMLGVGRLKTQLAPGTHLLSLRGSDGTVSTLQTHIRAGTLNIVEVPVEKTFTQR